MLVHISIRNFVLVDELSLDFVTGMNVFTGETGTGKSILLNALGLTLGDRGSPSLVRGGAERAEISTVFDITKIPQAQEWLKDKDFSHNEECILRRTLSQNGTSRAFINGTPVTLENIRDLSCILISIQGQHAHQTLLQRESHMKLLDDYGKLTKLADDYARAYDELLVVRRSLQHFYQKESLDEQTLALLEHEVEELEAVALSPQEYAHLEEEHSRLNNVESLMELAQQAIHLLDNETDDPSLLTQLNSLIALLQNTQDKKLGDLVTTLLDTESALSDVQAQLRSYLDSLVADPQRFDELNEKLISLHNLARKHRTEPQLLLEIAKKKRTSLQEHSHIEEKLLSLEKRVKEKHNKCLAQAKVLTAKRKKAAVQFDKEVTEQLRELKMPCRFATQFTKRDDLGRQGDSVIEFLLATTTKSELLPLKKIISGGELSRSALGIHIITAQNSFVPCLVFDEIDSGIGGAVAGRVGRSLAELGKTAQIICITHHPQVAVYGNAHYAVNKIQDSDKTFSTIKQLNENEKKQEIGRMIGGEKLTDDALYYASKLMEEARHHGAR